MRPMPIGYVLLAIIGVAVLMVVHESGHYFAARYFGMRVTTFSIGFGPTLWSHRPEGSPTMFQIGIIPFLAYVRIEGLNPFEESDPNDKSNYQNASLWARIVTITAGSAANYLFAFILIFLGLVIGGKREYDETSMKVRVERNGPAAMAGLQTGDKILKIAGVAVHDWKELPTEIGKRAGQPTEIEVERDGAVMQFTATPGADGEYVGKIQISPDSTIVPVPFGEAVVTSIKAPPKVVYGLVRGIAQLIAKRETPGVSGPVGIVKDVSRAVEMGFSDTFRFLGALSAYLGVFNLLPFPALDGGRLLFLLYEAVARRKVNAKAEAMVHVAGLLMFLTLMVVVTIKEIMPGR